MEKSEKNYDFWIFAFKCYRPKKPCAVLRNALKNGLKFHILVFLGLLGNNVHVQIEKLRPLKDKLAFQPTSKLIRH
jgi:hypothetical protein